MTTTIETIDATTARDTETGARIHRTPRGWWVAVQTGMPTDAVRVGEGDTQQDAIADLSRTAIQSVGPDCGEADALEWASHQSGAGFRLAVDGDGWELEDAP